MADYAWKWKQHDLGAVVAARGTLLDADELPVDLTGATNAYLVYKLDGGGTVVRRTVVIDANQVTNKGKWSYVPISADTATPGDYNFEIEVDWGANGTQTFPTDGQYTFQVVDDVDA